MIVGLMSDGTDRRAGDVFDALKSKGRKSKGSEKSQRSMIAQALSKLAKSGMIQKKGRGIYGR
jgi:ribosomal protein S19E (S16A)